MRGFLRGIFHWQYSGWVIALACGLAMTAALANKFGLAYFCLVVACLFSVGRWLTSEFLEKKTTPPKRRILMPDGAPAEVLPRWRRIVWMWRLIPAMACISIFVIGGVWVRSIQLDKELESLSGWLYPSDEKVDACSLDHPDDIAVMMGNSGYVEDRFPHTLLAFNCDDVLKLERDKQGRVGITLTVLDKNGRVIVALRHGHFDVNQNNYFQIDRQGSRSTLSVIDQNNRRGSLFAFCQQERTPA